MEAPCREHTPVPLRQDEQQARAEAQQCQEEKARLQDLRALSTTADGPGGTYPGLSAQGALHLQVRGLEVRARQTHPANPLQSGTSSRVLKKGRSPCRASNT